MFYFDKGKDESCEDPYEELFLWAVLCNLPEMAVYFWVHGKEALAKALIGMKLFEEMAKVGENEQMLDESIEELRRNARFV